MLMLLTATGCGGQDAVMVGNISSLTPTFCIATPDASGGCFKTKSVSLNGLTVGQCVRATYEGSREAPGGQQLKSLTPSNDCAPS
jgi:hypothetical protein